MSIKDWYNNRLELAKKYPQIDLPQLGINTKGTAIPIQKSTFVKKYGKDSWPKTKFGHSSGFTVLGIPFYNENISKSRHYAIAAHEEMHRLFNEVEQKFGIDFKNNLIDRIFDKVDPITVAYLSKSLAEFGYNSNESHKFKEEIINYCHTYLTDPLNKKRIDNILGSKFKAHVLQKTAKESWDNIINFTQNLSFNDLITPLNKMAVHQTDWKAVVDGHSDEAENSVDHKLHLKNFSAPDNFVKMLNSDEVFSGIAALRAKNVIAPDEKTVPTSDTSRNEGDSNLFGVCPKMIHTIPAYKFNNTEKETYMVKPYHKAKEDISNPMVQHLNSGWAAVTTKALYNAAGIGHLCEDIGVHEHHGIPITVHKFNNNAVDVISLGNNPIQKDPLLVNQIAIMDYLTNNVDRHAFNLMYDKKQNLPLAIDHERSFQYMLSKLDAKRKLNNENTDRFKLYEPETPDTYIKNSALLKIMPDEIKFNEYNLVDVADWWFKHSQKIKDEFLENLKAIKDPKVKSHIYDNFMSRAEALDKWSKDTLESGEAYDYSDSGHFDDVNITPFSSYHNKELEEFVDKLPKTDPKTSINMIVNTLMKRKRITEPQKRIIRFTFEHLLQDSTPSQLVELLDHSIHNPHYRSLAKRGIPLDSIIYKFLSKDISKNKTNIENISHIKEFIDYANKSKNFKIKNWAKSLKHLVE